MIRFPRYFSAAALGCLLLCSVPGQGAENEPFHVGFVPGREELVVADSRGSILLLSYPELEVVREFSGDSTSTFTGIAVSGSGAWLAADYSETGTRIWDLETGEEQLRIANAEARSNPVFLFHPYDDTLLIFRGGELERWDVARAREGEPIRAVRWAVRMSVSPNGRYLVIEGDCLLGSRSFGLCVYQLEQDVVLATLDKQPLLGGAPESEGLAYLADHRIALRANTYQVGDGVMLNHTHLLSPGELRQIDSRLWGSANPDESSTYRQAPQRQLRDTTADGSRRIQALLESRELCLYGTDTTRENGTMRRVKCVPWP